MLPAIRALRGSDLIEQIRVTVQHLEQFHQGQRRFSLAVLVPREGIDPTAGYWLCAVSSGNGTEPVFGVGRPC